MSQIPLKMMLISKVVKSDSKIIITLCQSKSVTHFVSSAARGDAMGHFHPNV